MAVRPIELCLPIVSKIRNTLIDRLFETTVIYRTNDDRRDIRPQFQDRIDTILGSSTHRGGHVDDRVAVFSDTRDELLPDFWIVGRSSVARIARMQMDDGGPCLGRVNRLGCNLVWRHRQMR